MAKRSKWVPGQTIGANLRGSGVTLERPLSCTFAEVADPDGDGVTYGARVDVFMSHLRPDFENFTKFVPDRCARVAPFVSVEARHDGGAELSDRNRWLLYGPITNETKGHTVAAHSGNQFDGCGFSV